MTLTKKVMTIHGVHPNRENPGYACAHVSPTFSEGL